MSGQVVFISAGASGIGAVVAKFLLEAGHTVAVCDVDEDALARLSAVHADVQALRADVARTDEIEAAFAEVQNRHGHLDVLINNAGIAGPTARIEDIEPADWQRTLEVDLGGAFHCTRLAVPLLRKSKSPSIINISSTAGLFGCPLRSPYVACKWALIGLTKTWAMELGPEGFRVNAICPGSVEGPRIQGVIERDADVRGLATADVRAEYQRQTSLRTFVDAGDIAALIGFLISQAGRFISGQAIAIDGHTEGLSSALPPPVR